MNLGLEIAGLPSKGRKPYNVSPRETPEGSSLKKLSQRHHNLARHIASGVRPCDAAVMCGYTKQRVITLSGDPAFKELVNFYADQANLEYAGLHEKMATLAIDVTDELQRRIEEEPEDITTSQLLAIAEKMADRTGYGPAVTNNNVHLHTDVTNSAVERLGNFLSAIKTNNSATLELEVETDRPNAVKTADLSDTAKPNASNKKRKGGRPLLESTKVARRLTKAAEVAAEENGAWAELSVSEAAHDK